MTCDEQGEDIGRSDGDGLQQSQPRRPQKLCVQILCKKSIGLYWGRCAT